MKVLEINKINKCVCLHKLDMSVSCMCVILTFIGISTEDIGIGRGGNDNRLENIGSIKGRLPRILNVRGELMRDTEHRNGIYSNNPNKSASL
jgi:hypothetical protein